MTGHGSTAIGAEPAAKGSRFERRDVAPRRVLVALVALVCTIALSMGIVAGFLRFLDARRTEPTSATESAPTVSGIDRAAVEAAARRRLAGYAWTNRSAGRARIPIERAMEILAERGWPDGDAGR
ncbi:MAG: hypothetical protein AB7P02_16820 [Alphaproteobacteria bacterium]